jgi:hypothetical protein
MARVSFSRHPLVLGRCVRRVSPRTIASTPSLVDVSLDDALRHGGPLVERVLAAMALRRDRRHIVVLVQVAHLVPGDIPNGPGWHTDGVPVAPGRYRYATDDPAIRPDRFHLVVAGEHCRTVFAEGPVWLRDPESSDSRERRRSFTRQLARIRPPVFQVPGYRVLEYDGWALHTSIAAQAEEWRAFVRVTETDHHAPRPMAAPAGQRGARSRAARGGTARRGA